MIEIKGADQLADLAKRLKEAGDRELQRELGKAINSAVKPVKQAIHDSAETTLPRRGGLAEEAASSRIVTRRRSGARAGVRVVAQSPKLSLYHLNQGIVRHRSKSGWTIQRITPGFWDKPTQELAEDARREIVAALDEVAKKLDGR